MLNKNCNNTCNKQGWFLMSINTDHSVFNTTPVDVLPIIFENLSLETDIVALVCKKWKEIVDSEMFCEIIRPPRVMGIKQLIMQNPNIIFEGKEHPLPRKFYKEYAMKGGLCFFNPGRVKLKIADGEYKLVVLNSLEAIASLFPNAKLKTRFTSSSWEEVLKEIRKEEAPHWVWEEAKVRGFNKTYAKQQEMAKEEDKALYPERYQAIEENPGMGCSQNAPKSSELNQRFNISTGILSSLKAIANLFKYLITAENKPKQIVIMSNEKDHVLGKFMAEAILGEREVTWDSRSDKYGLIRVKSTIKLEGKWLTVGLTRSGLCVHHDYGIARGNVGFVCARKFFDIGGIRKNSLSVRIAEF